MLKNRMEQSKAKESVLFLEKSRVIMVSNLVLLKIINDLTAKIYLKMIWTSVIVS